MDQDPVISVIETHNRAYRNTGYRKGIESKFGDGQVHPVSFEGEDGRTYTSYVFEDRAGKLIPYGNISDLFLAGRGEPRHWLRDEALLKTVTISIVVMILALGAMSLIVHRVVVANDKDALSGLIGLLGAALGYVAGKK